MMARIFESDEGFMYEVDDYVIDLNDNSYIAFQHRLKGFRLMDWIGVLDDRDGEYFSHWRYDQPEEAFEEMLGLVKKIGTYILSDTPYDHIGTMFENNHSLKESDFEHLLESE